MLVYRCSVNEFLASAESAPNGHHETAHEHEAWPAGPGTVAACQPAHEPRPTDCHIGGATRTTNPSQSAAVRQQPAHAAVHSQLPRQSGAQWYAGTSVQIQPT